MKICGKCGHSCPDNWAIPFNTLALLAVPGLREASKRGEVCEWCHCDRQGLPRPTEAEVLANRYLGPVIG